ncbi:hypothetical protein B0H14DRAFT_2631529 [Mycena olivaceomarginata]|nr:hypothetical protein B0H14DRAFT_2631529 [Mycena olivaceomarginata]
MSPKYENTRWDRGFYWSDVGVLESRWGASTRQCEHVEWKLNNGIATARIDGRFSTFPGSAREREIEVKMNALSRSRHFCSVSPGAGITRSSYRHVCRKQISTHRGALPEAGEVYLPSWQVSCTRLGRQLGDTIKVPRSYGSIRLDRVPMHSISTYF